MFGILLALSALVVVGHAQWGEHLLFPVVLPIELRDVLLSEDVVIDDLRVEHGSLSGTSFDPFENVSTFQPRECRSHLHARLGSAPGLEVRPTQGEKSQYAENQLSRSNNQNAERIVRHRDLSLQVFCVLVGGALLGGLGALGAGAWGAYRIKSSPKTLQKVFGALEMVALFGLSLFLISFPFWGLRLLGM